MILLNFQWMVLTKHFWKVCVCVCAHMCSCWAHVCAIMHACMSDDIFECQSLPSTLFETGFLPCHSIPQANQANGLWWSAAIPVSSSCVTIGAHIDVWHHLALRRLQRSTVKCSPFRAISPAQEPLLKVLKRGKSHRPSLLDEELQAVKICWQRENLSVPDMST